MDEVSRNIILNNIDFLVHNTKDFKRLIKSLKLRNLFNLYMIKNIEEADDQLRHLYKKITKRGPAAFEHLLSALSECNEDDVVTFLVEKRYNSLQYEKIIVENSEVRMDLKDGKVKSDCYEMGSSPRGYALIINIHDYLNCKYDYESEIQEGKTGIRFGSYRDVAKLYLLFHQLGYYVLMHYDVTEENFWKIIDAFKEDSYEVDSNVIILMSHGKLINNRHAFQLYDHRYILLDNVHEELNSKNFRSANGKPKIIIYQACCGDEHDLGIPVTSDHNSHSDSCRRNNESEDYSISYEGSSYDFITIYPSMTGYVSMRDKFEGTWLIQAICKVFAKNAKDKNLIELLHLVNEYMRKKYNYPEGVQTPEFRATTCKKIYFNPGLMIYRSRP